MRAARRALIAAGAIGVGYAVCGALTDSDANPLGMLIFLAGVLVAHDGILLPLVIGVGAVVGRFVPVRPRTPVRVALIVSFAVFVVALPLVLGYGRTADNPSVLPRDYRLSLGEVLAVVWATTLAVITVRRRRARARRTDAATDPPSTRRTG